MRYLSSFQWAMEIWGFESPWNVSSFWQCYMFGVICMFNFEFTLCFHHRCKQRTSQSSSLSSISEELFICCERTMLGASLSGQVQYAGSCPENPVGSRGIWFGLDLEVWWKVRLTIFWDPWVKKECIFSVSVSKVKMQRKNSTMLLAK